MPALPIQPRLSHPGEGREGGGGAGSLWLSAQFSKVCTFEVECENTVQESSEHVLTSD